MPLLSTIGGLTAQSFGGKIAIGGSAFFDTQGDVLFMSPGTPFAYGLGDFTIEMWFYPTSFSGNRVLWHQGAESTTTTTFIGFRQVRTFNDRRYLTLYLNSAGQASMEVFGNSAYRTTSNTATLNAWNHVALVRSGGNVRIFLNGTPTAPAGLAGSNFTDTSVYTPCIGRFSYGPLGFTGYITNVRVAKSAYYSAVFDPSRTPFTRNSQGATSVQLLLNHLTSARFLTDSSANNLTVTNSGTFFNNLSPYNSPYVPFGVVTTVSAVVTPNVTTANEGDTITFTVAGTNTANGTYYYTIEQPAGDLTGADFTSGSLSGTFNISGNSGTFVLSTVRDLSTEGDSTFAVYVRSGSITGPVLGTSAEINLVDSSITPEFITTPASINEGNSATFTVQNVGPDGTYFFTVLNGTTANADFSTVSGSFVVSGSTGGIDNGSGSFNITPVFDYTTEGAQTFQVQVRSGSTSGPVIVTSNSVTINDTSQNPTVSITTATETGFNFSTTGMSSGTFYWTVNHITTSPEDFSPDSGSFFRNNNNIQENHFGATVADYVTEGNETFTISVRTGSISGPIIATSNTGTITDTTKTVTVTPSSSTMAEGGTISIFVGFGDNQSSIPNGTTVAWSIVHGTTSPADFSGPTSGLIVNAFGSGTDPNGIPIQITAASDVVFETDETFQVDIRFQNGTLIKRSEVITITGIA
jgi:hypothetical protein